MTSEVDRDTIIAEAVKVFQNSPANSRVPKTINYLNVRIFPNYVEVYENGVAKAISTQDFVQALSTGVTLAEQANSIAMPPGCFMFSKNSSMFEMNLYFPERTAEISFMSYNDRNDYAETKYTIPIPNTILYIVGKIRDKSWDITSIQYFATPKTVGQFPIDRMITKYEPAIGVYRFPLPNMYDNNTMCYGNNSVLMRFPENNLRGCEWYYQVITNSPFNADLSIRGVDSQYSSPRNWLEHLSELSAFPYELLK